MLEGDGHRRVGGERRLPGEHLGQDAAERVEVGPAVDLGRGGLFGREVAAVPSTVAVCVSCEPDELARAIPKLTTFTPPSWVIMMFPGLMSRCTRPAPCATSSASQTAAAMPTARSTGSPRAPDWPAWASRWLSEVPCTSSMTMYGEPWSTPESKTMTIRGWASIAACCASRPKRSAKRGSSARPPLSTLTATALPSTRSWARQTVAIPPTPSISTSGNGRSARVRSPGSTPSIRRPEAPGRLVHLCTIAAEPGDHRSAGPPPAPTWGFRAGRPMDTGEPTDRPGSRSRSRVMHRLHRTDGGPGGGSPTVRPESWVSAPNHRRRGPTGLP